MRYALFSILSILALTAALQAAQPDWVSDRPHAQAYYVGIGVAPTGADPAESRDRATRNAFNDIATQIEVNISSDITNKTSEDLYGVHQEYLSEIQTIVSTELAGVEIVDTWEGNGEIWVYARLSKEKFAEYRRQKIDDARRQAYTLFSQAEGKRLFNPADALALYLQALEPIAAALGDPLSVEHDGDMIDLDTAVPARVRDLLSSIELTAEPVPPGVKRGADIDVPIEILALRQTGRGRPRPVDGLPLDLAFTEGEGRIVGQARTRSDGKAVSRLTRIEDAGRAQVIRARVDLAAMAPGVSAGLLALFTPPEVDINLSVSRQRVYVQSREANLGRPLQVPVLEPIVKRLLSSRGVEFADRAADADLLVAIEADTRQGNRFQSIHFTFLDLTLSLRRADGTEIFKTSLTDIKGSGPNFQQAGVKAFTKTGKELEGGALADALDRL